MAREARKLAGRRVLTHSCTSLAMAWGSCCPVGGWNMGCWLISNSRSTCSVSPKRLQAV